MKIFKRGCNDRAVVRYIQSMCNIELGKFCADQIDADGLFGEKTEKAVIRLQDRYGVDTDGLVGPETWRMICSVNQLPAEFLGDTFFHRIGLYHPYCGPVHLWENHNSGKCSSFGGPDDAGDRMYGQAFLYDVTAPNEINQYMPKLVDKGFFRREVLDLDEFPIVTDYEGREHKAGLSWALDPSAPYCAVLLDQEWIGHLRGDRCPSMMVSYNGKSIVCRLTDRGPATRTGRMIDLSPGAMEYLGVKTDQKVEYMWVSQR